MFQSRHELRRALRQLVRRMNEILMLPAAAIPPFERRSIAHFRNELMEIDTRIHIVDRIWLDGFELYETRSKLLDLEAVFDDAVQSIGPLTKSWGERICEASRDFRAWLWRNKWKLGACIGLTVGVTSVTIALAPTLLGLSIACNVGLKCTTALTAGTIIPLAIGMISTAVGTGSVIACTFGDLQIEKKQSNGLEKEKNMSEHELAVIPAPWESVSEKSYKDDDCAIVMKLHFHNDLNMD